PRVEVVQTGFLGGLYGLPVQSEAVVPTDAGLDEVRIGQRLHYRAGAVIVEPAQTANEFLAIAVTPQFQFVRGDRVDAELHSVAGPAPLRPGVPEEPIGQQAKLDWLVGCDGDTNAFGAVTGFAQAHAILAGRNCVFVNRPGRGGRAAPDIVARPF